MGKGDKKTKRGKIVNKSYGVRRARKKSKNNSALPASVISEEVEAKPKTPPKIKAAPKPKAEAAPKAAVKPRATKKKAENPEE
jgi:30S ribosomal protein S31